MSEPSRASLPRVLAAGLVAALALAGGGFAIGRYSAPPRDPVIDRAAAPVIAPLRPPPIPQPPTALGRGELIAAVRAAVSAFAAGGPTPMAVAELVGRQFEIRLPFGCHGPAAAGAAEGWRYDADRETLRVQALPAHLDPRQWRLPEAANVDAIEAFWIERPWTDSEACPPAGPDAPAVPERTIGVAQFHRADEPRTARRDREGFEAVVRAAAATLDLSRGLQLRLTGRVAPVPGGAGPVLCRAPTLADRPVCLLAMSLESVAVENPSTDAPLATWDVASSRTGS